MSGGWSTRDQVERIVPLLQRGEGARLQQQALMIHVVGQAVLIWRRTDRVQRLLRLLVHQIDHRQPRRDLRACDAVQPLVDLIVRADSAAGPSRSTATRRSDMRRIISSPSGPIGVRSMKS